MSELQSYRPRSQATSDEQLPDHVTLPDTVLRENKPCKEYSSSRVIVAPQETQQTSIEFTVMGSQQKYTFRKNEETEQNHVKRETNRPELSLETKESATTNKQVLAQFEPQLPAKSSLEITSPVIPIASDASQTPLVLPKSEHQQSANFTKNIPSPEISVSPYIENINDEPVDEDVKYTIQEKIGQGGFGVFIASLDLTGLERQPNSLSNLHKNQHLQQKLP